MTGRSCRLVVTLLLLLLFLQTGIGTVARVGATGVARVIAGRSGWWVVAAGRTRLVTAETAAAATFFGLRHRVFVLRFAVDVVDVVRSVRRIVNLLPTVRQFIFGALFQRFLLDFR